MDIVCKKCSDRPGNEREYMGRSEGIFCAPCYIRYLQEIRGRLEREAKEERRDRSDRNYARSEFGPA